MLRAMYASVLLFIVLVCLAAFFLLWKRLCFYFFSYKLKGSTNVPCVGNFLDLPKNSEDILEHLIENAKKHGTPFGAWLGSKLFVYTSNPEDFEILLQSPSALNKKEIYDFYKPLLGEGLGTCSDGKEWRQNRKLMTKMFNQRALNRFLNIFQKYSIILCEQLETKVGKKHFNVHSWLALCHMDIIFGKWLIYESYRCCVSTNVSEATTGVKVNAQKGESIYMKHMEKLYDVMYSRLTNVLLYPNFIYKRTKLGAKQEELLNYIENFNKNILQSKQKQHEWSPQDKLSENLDEFSENSTPFMDYLTKTGQFTDEELDTELTTLIVGGTDTGVTIESFALMMLGMHKILQDKVFKEQQEIFGDNQREITPADLSKMNYLERVIKETMRLFPVSGLLFRTITNDIKLRTCTVTKDTTVLLGVLDAHRSPSLWKDPLKFDPDRFLPEKIAKQHSYSYVPFSAGPRDCIGKRFGMMVMKVILSNIVRKYRIYCEYNDIEDIKVIQHFTLKPKDGFKVSLELRN